MPKLKNRYQLIIKIVEDINNNKEVDVDKLYKPYMHCGTFINPISTTKPIISALEGKPRDDINPILSFYSRSVPRKWSQKQISNLKLLCKLISESTNSCKHKHIGIIPLIHGGGMMCPPTCRPEVVCSDCGANVTIPSLRTYTQEKPGGPLIKITPLQVGLCINKKDNYSLTKWAETYNSAIFCGSKIKAHLFAAEDIIKDPFGTYKASQKYKGPASISIISIELFNRVSSTTL